MSQSNETFVIRDRRPGYLRVYNDLYDHYGAQLGPYGLAVYMALCRYANQDSEAWPSYTTIARGTGMSKRQVIREIHKMEELRIIAVERNQNTSNIFVLLDTSAQYEPPRGDTQSPPPVTHSHPPSDTQSPKQDLLNKRSTRNKNKTQSADLRSSYLPAEYADIIIG